jgi:hypothetical protein
MSRTITEYMVPVLLALAWGALPTAATMRIPSLTPVGKSRDLAS